MPDQPVPDIVVHRHLAERELRIFQQGTDFTGQLGAHNLIGVDLQDPVAGRRVHAGRSPRAFQREHAADHHRSVGLADRPRPVGAAVEHQHDLVDEPERVETARQPPLLVMHAKHRRKSGHQRSPTNERRSRTDGTSVSFCAASHCRDSLYVIFIVTCGDRPMLLRIALPYRAAPWRRQTCAGCGRGPFRDIASSARRG